MISDQKLFLKKRTPTWLSGSIQLAASKSESNRLLLIQALSGQALNLSNLSEARDTQTMNKLLSDESNIWDVKDAGTTMRFLTAYLAVHGEGQTITGTDRMKQRPIGLLVDALRRIGATVQYLEEDGFPPLKITKIGKQLTHKITIPGNVSSQYISALLMIAPHLPTGLEIELSSAVTSRPYIEMTLKLMANFQVSHLWEENLIKIKPQHYSEGAYEVESDWSGASYWYSFVALSPNPCELSLPNLRENSNQGDQQIVEIMKEMGVKTQFTPEGVTISQLDINSFDQTLDFKDCPDLAQTVMVVAASKGIKLTMTGLESLKIKETNRVQAMTAELAKIGAQLSDNGDEWVLEPSKSLPDRIDVSTYEDHRMAMAFAPLCLLMDLTLEDQSVVNKSFPGFWDELERLNN